MAVHGERNGQERYLGAWEVARRYDVTVATVARWCRLKLLPNATRAAGRSRAWRIPETDLEGFERPTIGGTGRPWNVGEEVTIANELAQDWPGDARVSGLSEFGEWLSERMARAGLYPKRVARLVGVSHVTVLKWMRGKFSPRDHNVRRLAHVLGVDPMVVYRAIAGATEDPDGWPAEVYTLVGDYLALPPGLREALRGVVYEARRLHEADQEPSGDVG